MRPFGFNVIAHASSNVGVGVSARSVTQVLLAKGYPVAILDLDSGQGRKGQDLSLSKYFVASPNELPYAVNLSILSILSLPDVFVDLPELFEDDFLNVGCFWWELAVLPESWLQGLQFFDVLLAGSRFAHATLESQLSNVFTLFFEHPLKLPDDIQPSRKKYGLPSDATVFITICEPSSDFTRKNPLAAIEAFKRALSDDLSAHLVVKVNNAAAGSLNPTLERIRAECATHSRIHLVEASLTYSEILSLYAACDVFVALHRSEGLGLGLMEAMALGKPVIATAWSGNMTYMDHTNSCLVRYRLVPVSGSIPVYQTKFLGKEALWADPDIDHAATWMKTLVADETLRRNIGAKAAEDMATFQKSAQEGRFIEQVRSILSQRDAMPALDGEQRRADLRRYRNHVNDSRLTRSERVAKRVTRLLDQHVRWRFQRNQSAQLETK